MIKFLKEWLTSYNNDFTKIQNRLLNYKDHIIENVKTNLFGVINTFFQNVNEQIYNNYYVIGLNEFIYQAKESTSNFGEFRLLSASYNVGEIIYNIPSLKIFKVSSSFVGGIPYNFSIFFAIFK